MKRKAKILFLTVLVVTSSCSEYQKLLKSTDYELKYEKAIEYFDNLDFARADDLFYELMPIYRGTTKGEAALYYFACCQFAMRDYIYAGNFYRELIDNYPTSKYAEESNYMIAYCYYLNSPNSRLDQTSSYEAIGSFQEYIKQYPNSHREEEAQQYIDELIEKLVEKSYLNSKLYYDMGRNYNAAIVSLENSLQDYSFTKHRESLRFMLLKSYTEYALNSVKQKQRDRLERAIEEYYSFIAEYPESKYRQEANKIYDKMKQSIN